VGLCFPCPTPSHLELSSKQPAGQTPALSLFSGRSAQLASGGNDCWLTLLISFSCLSIMQVGHSLISSAGWGLTQSVQPASCDVLSLLLWGYGGGKWQPAIPAIALPLLQQPSHVKTINKANEPPRPCLFSPSVWNHPSAVTGQGSYILFPGTESWWLVEDVSALSLCTYCRRQPICVPLASGSCRRRIGRPVLAPNIALHDIVSFFFFLFPLCSARPHVS
jgi:hypothetical protein